ncbi:MAG: hypothetical protein JKY04_05215 [Sneathiella sp.]|nr:hypothetical protein [Sneathiella sp.]
MISKFKPMKTIAILAGTMILSACAGGLDTDLFSSNKRLLPCPNVSVLPNADAITIFRAGPGRDLVDVEFEGVIVPTSGECLYEDDDTMILAELILRIGAIKGPAATGQEKTFPFFVAIADKDKRILSKKIFQSPIQIPEGKRRGGVQEEIVQRIPISSGRTGRDYTIVLGFQLTAEQLEYNRKAAR